MNRFSVTFGVVCLVVGLLMARPEVVRGQPDADVSRNGAALYGERCAECHGADATGVSGPDLTGLWVAGATDERVFATIRSGRPGSIMPPSTAPDNEVRSIVEYLKTLGAVASIESVGGDVDHGEAIFEAMCIQCHRVSGRGGSLGPDLSHMVETRTLDEIRTAVRDPSSSVSARYRAVVLVTRDARRIRGVVKGEDAFSVQLMDIRERLQGFLKSDLQEIIREDRSPMPQFSSERLSDQDLLDVVQFLGTP